MTIEFGKVEKYIQNRGFGFISCCFRNEIYSHQFGSNENKVFFHIKVIENFNYEIFRRLKSGNIDDLYFWFEIEKNNKGEQVVRLLSSDDEQIKNNPKFIEVLKHKFLDVSVSLPKWVKLAINDVFDKEEISILKNEISNLGQEKAKQKLACKKVKQVENDRLVAIRQQEAQLIIDRKEMEEREFQQLVNEIRNLGFTESKQVSKYIRKNRLGYRYGNLTGVLRMGKGLDAWDFVGGIHYDFYTRLCSTLNLSSQKSGAKPTYFKSFNDLRR